MQPLVITTTSDRSKCFQLERSLKHFGWTYYIIEHEWGGFLDKLHYTYKYLKTVTGHTHFLYTDAWDTFALRASVDVPDGLLIAAERACYPHPDKAGRYPEHKSPWHFVNGGGFCGEIAAFIKLYELNPPTSELNDQVWLTDMFLRGLDWARLDYECSIFQTLGFCPESDFDYSRGIRNTITNSTPAFIHGNGHTPMDNIYKLLPMFTTLQEVQDAYADKPETHKLINDYFTDNVNNTPALKAYRDWIEQKIFGFGERSFLWMWKLLVDEVIGKNWKVARLLETHYQNDNFSFLEIGVFRGQILGLIRMLAPDAYIAGITPLDSTGNHWDSDYAADIELLHTTHGLQQPEIIKGLSTDERIIAQASGKLWDIVYIDGGHSYEVAYSDIYYYSSFVKLGGYLVIDDACNAKRLPEGMFAGIEEVSRACDKLLPNEYYTEVFSVVHNRVFKKVK